MSEMPLKKANRRYCLARMQFHLAKAEAWQKTAEALEEMATDRGNAAEKANGTNAYYFAQKYLEGDMNYRRAVSSRNAHQAQVKMYSLAALALVGEDE